MEAEWTSMAGAGATEGTQPLAANLAEAKGGEVLWLLPASLQTPESASAWLTPDRSQLTVGGCRGHPIPLTYTEESGRGENGPDHRQA